MKKILVTQSSMPDFEEYCQEIKELWDSHWLTNSGSKHNEFQRLLEERLEVPHVTLYTNGHLALENIISSFNFPKGAEVITTPFTFASTTHSIVRNGLTPVFCDVNDEDYTMDVSKIESLITDKTCAILPVHVYGNICNVYEIERIAKKYDLKVIYDAAHAFGVKYDNKDIASFGDASMFSFHATKVFNTIEGGALCYKDDSLVSKLNDLKNFGIHGTDNVEYVGGNAKMNEFQAAMGICNLRHLDSEISKREKVVKRYRENLSNTDGIVLCKEQYGVISNYAYFPAVFNEKEFGSGRNDVFDFLAANDICARKYFYPLTNSFNCYNGKFDVNDTPVALHYSKRILTLPLYADLEISDVDRICDLILKLKK